MTQAQYCTVKRRVHWISELDLKTSKSTVNTLRDRKKAGQLMTFVSNFVCAYGKIF